MNRLGIDIGGTTTKWGVFDAAGGQRAGASYPTPTDLPGLLEALTALIACARQNHDVTAAGIGVPGFIERSSGRILLSPNLPCLDGVRLARELRCRCDLPVTIENDANAAAFGEWTARPRPRPSSFVHLTLGTGIGSGILLGGKLWRGSRGYAGELGHVTVNTAGRRCPCGNIGCAETESSAIGIVRTYREGGGDPGVTSSLEIYHRATGGDRVAREAFARAGEFLAILLVAIQRTLNPAEISLGGGVAAAGDLLLLSTREELARRLSAKLLDLTRLAPALLGNRAGMIGAAALAATPKKT